jgi:cyanobactin maturation PatA/PatG family protease
MMDVEVPGLRELQARTLGHAEIAVAVLDGPVDLAHPCFAGANVRAFETLVEGGTTDGAMSTHGTHVASVIFGQPGSPVEGIAPRCRGMVFPVFRDGDGERLSQLDLARAIEQAVHEGAHVINISGGERTPTAEPDGLLARALALCASNGVLVVAAVGNDGRDCLQVPAAVESALAVGALGSDGRPLDSSNWGETYRTHGIVAPGQSLLGAAPGGGTVSMTGSSSATPIVSAVAALVLSARRHEGADIDPIAVGRSIVESATPCRPEGTEQCRRYLAGALRVPHLSASTTSRGEPDVTTHAAVEPAPPDAARLPTEPDAGVLAASIDDEVLDGGLVPSEDEESRAAPEELEAERPYPIGSGAGPATGGRPAGGCGCGGPTAARKRVTGGVRPSGDCGCGGATTTATRSFVYTIGSIGYDFGTEARRDGFRQQMEDVEEEGIPVFDQSPPRVVFHRSPPNPYDPRQIAAYLGRNPWASNKLIWTLNLDRTPIYALEAEASVGMTWGEAYYDDEDRPTGIDYGFPPVSFVHKAFREAIVGQLLPDTDANYVSRVSIPGVLTDRTVRLYSGQVVPVVVVSARGLYAWNEPALVSAAVAAVESSIQDDAARRGTVAAVPDAEALRQNIRAFLDKVYYQFRNLGQSSPDRALNYAATNAFLFTNEIRQGLLSATYVPGPNSGLFTLDTISVSKSPYCRMDSDCWDVVITFFDPENDRRARVSYLFTIDVSDELPVSLAPTHRFLNAM